MPLRTLRSSALALALAALSVPLQAEAKVIGTLQDAYTDKAWSFFWNEVGQYNDPSGYSPMVATNLGEEAAAQYTADASQPEWLFVGYISSGASPTYAGRVGGLPGPGIEQSASKDRARAAAFAYTVPEDGTYAIEHSSLTNATESVDGLQVDVILGGSQETLLTQRTNPGTGESVKFDISLGKLTKGDVFYIVISPRGNNYADIFAIDCDIVTK
jgi:hypothetical protein